MGQFIQQDTPALVTTTAAACSTSATTEPQPNQQQQEEESTKMMLAVKSPGLICSRSRRSVRFDNEIAIIDDDDDDEGQHEPEEEGACDTIQQEDQEASDSSSSLWYTQEDYSQFRARNLVYLQRASRSTIEEDDDEEWTSRGFEYVTQRYPRKQLRMEHSMCVLDFQDVLGGPGSCPTALADYATNSSTANGSQCRAQKMGLFDEQIAAQIHQQQQQLEQQDEQIHNNYNSSSSASTPQTISATTACSNSTSTAITTTTTSSSSDRYYVPVVIGWSMSMLKFFPCF